MNNQSSNNIDNALDAATVGVAVFAASITGIFSMTADANNGEFALASAALAATALVKMASIATGYGLASLQKGPESF